MLPSLSFRKQVLLYLVYWLVWLLVHTYVLLDLGKVPLAAFADSLVTQLLFGAGSLLLFIMLRYYQPGSEHSFYLRLWVVLVAVGNTALLWNILPHVYRLVNADLPWPDGSLPLRFCYQVLMLAFVTLLGWMNNYFSEQQTLEERKKEAEKMARDAELYNLRQQLQPHFLFNSLNSISALAGSNPQQARKMIQQLSDFLRHTLRKDEQQLITLEEELHQLELYLSIEQVRFGNRLHCVIEANDTCKQNKLPGLILQPLVENAIKFGLYNTLGDVTINVKVDCEPRMLRLTITNPFDAEARDAAGGTGFGLGSVRRRLSLIYARQQLLQTRSEENLFIVDVSIPQL